ncbi:MAG TPA: phage virion morphogenesis protein [Usitatibacteraceae bacterium]
MAGDGIVIDYQGAAVNEYLTQLAMRCDAPEPAMGAIAEELLAIVQGNFIANGRPAWVALKPATVKARGGNATPILRVKGDLFSSIQPEHDATSAQVGTNLIKALILNSGGTIDRAAYSVPNVEFKGRKFAKKGKGTSKKNVTIGAHSITIPARPFMMIPDGEEIGIIDILRNFLITGQT